MDNSLLLHAIPVSIKPKLKRPCCSPFPDSTRIPNPNVNPSPNPLDALLESFLELSDSSAISLDLSIDRILESRPYDCNKNDVIERALRLGSALTEASKRCARRRASMHNAIVWPLPSDLTIKVLSLLDVQSICHAAATCSLFNKCAADPLCYSNIDLTTIVPKVNNIVVSTMIQRAGKVLRHVELRQTLESVSRSCPLIERLYFESSKTGRDDSLKLPTCHDLVTNCPHISSLALRGFKLHDAKVRVLFKGFRKLKYVDFSMSYSITGCFLRNLGGSTGSSLLEVLILRDCMHLREAEVSQLLSAIIAGYFKHLRHLDVSNREGLASDDDWYHRCFNQSFTSLAELLEERPNLCVVADFPPEGSFMEEPITSSDVNIDSDSSSHTSDGYVFSSSSESCFNSDQSSGNEEYPNSSYPVHAESSDEVDYL